MAADVNLVFPMMLDWTIRRTNGRVAGDLRCINAQRSCEVMVMGKVLVNWFTIKFWPLVFPYIRDRSWFLLCGHLKFPSRSRKISRHFEYSDRISWQNMTIPWMKPTVNQLPSVLDYPNVPGLTLYWEGRRLLTSFSWDQRMDKWLHPQFSVQDLNMYRYSNK